MAPVFYRKLGKGYPIILIHGFCETQEIWNGLADNLSRKFEIFLIDLPGFGGSPILTTPFSIDDVATKVLEWIDLKKITKPIVIGHSLGGYVTLSMAKQNSKKFAGLGLVQSSAFPDSEERKANRNKVIDFVKEHGKDPFIDTFVPGLFFNKKHPAISQVDKIARTTATASLRAYTEAMRDRSSSIDFIKSGNPPILFVGGEKDAIIPAEATLEQGQLAPNSVVYLLKNVGHMAMYESPLEVQNAIELFAGGLTKSMSS